jgi:hypothetical protein
MNHFRNRIGDNKPESKSDAPEGANMKDFVAKDRAARAPKIAKRDAQVAKQRSHFRGR